jgi:hypothetical protein
MRLLASRHESLPELAADALAAEQPKMPGTPGEAEQFAGPWGPEPLEVDR